MPRPAVILSRLVLRVADEAVGEPAEIVAGVGVIETRFAFEHGLAADVTLLRERDGEHRIAHRAAFAQRASAAARAFEVA